jgi:phosphomannomutase
VSIYLPCDIRGRCSDQLTTDLYRRWGAVLASQVDPGSKFVVAGDTRGSTPAFLAALQEGLCTADIDVVALGIQPTPIVYYAVQRIRADGCAIVTASHNAATMNGLKWMIGDCPPTPDDVAALAEAAEALPAELSAVPGRSPRSLDVTFDYVGNLQQTFVEAMPAQLHVVVDPLGGAWAKRARHYLQAIFPQCLFTTIHDTIDADFGGGSPDCSQQENLHELAAAVYRTKANLGIAFDGDGDRLAIVDDEGMPLSPEESLWIMLQALGDRLRGESVVCDLKYSDRIADAVRELGGTPLPERSGHAFVRARMCLDEALFGAEISGHYFFREMGGADDGLYAACRLIAFLGQQQASLANLRRQAPAFFLTPELRVEVPRGDQTATLQAIRQHWSQFPQSMLDGVRIDTPGGWILARPSITEPAMTFRFEAFDYDSLHDLVERFCESMPQIGPRLHSSYQAAMGAGDDLGCA